MDGKEQRRAERRARMRGDTTPQPPTQSEQENAADRAFNRFAQYVQGGVQPNGVDPQTATRYKVPIPDAMDKDVLEGIKQELIRQAASRTIIPATWQNHPQPPPVPRPRMKSYHPIERLRHLVPKGHIVHIEQEFSGEGNDVEHTIRVTNLNGNLVVVRQVTVENQDQLNVRYDDQLMQVWQDACDEILRELGVQRD